MPSADAMKHGLAAQGGLAPSPTGSKSMKSLPQFLAICWEEIGQDGVTVTRRATLCLPHRQEIALEYTSARGLRQLGESCDFCDGRVPRTVGGEPRDGQ